MSNKKLSFAILCFFFAIPLFAQIELRGTVKDTLKQPLAFVTISVQTAENSPIIAFTSTDEQGNYSVEITEEGTLFYVSAAILGYRTKMVNVTINTEKVKNLNFTLRQESIVLKETIIKASGKIIAKSDTITFKADAFRDGQDKVVEDLLKKLPGVEVSQQGAISVYGKPIKTILIEGDNMVNSQYTLLSRNLNASVIDKIQVIDKYNENPLLRKVARSEDKVLNITLKEEFKNLAFGNAILGIGNDWRTENFLNLFAFYKKIKFLSIGAFNTIGSNSLPELSNITDDPWNDVQENTTINTQNLVNLGSETTSELGGRKLWRNQAALGAVNFITRPAPKWIIKNLTYITRDKNTLTEKSQIQYLLPDSTITIRQTNDFLRKPIVFFNRLELTFQASANMLFKNSSEFSIKNSQSSVQTDLNDNKIQDFLDLKQSFFSNKLDFTWRINDTRAITSDVFFYTNTMRENFDLSQSQMRNLPFLNLSSRHFIQNSDLPQQNLRWQMHYLVTNTKQEILQDKWVWKAIFEHKNNQLLSDFNVQQNDGNWFASDINLQKNYFNDEYYRQNRAEVGVKYSKKIEKIEWIGNVSGHYFDILFRSNYANEQRNTTKDYNTPFYFQLNLAAEYKQNEQQKYNIALYKNVDLPQLIDLYGGFTLTDTRTFQRGSRVQRPIQNYSFSADYRYKLSEKGLTAYASYIYGLTQGNYTNNILINPDFQLFEKIPANEHFNNHFVNIGVDKFIPAWSSSLKWKVNYAYFYSQNQLNNSDTRDVQSSSLHTEATIRSAYNFWVNYHTGIYLNYFKTQIKALNFKNNNYNTNIFFDLNFKFSSKFSAKLAQEVFYFRQFAINQRYYFFMDASAHYNLIEKHIYISLIAQNILNKAVFAQSSASDFANNLTQYALYPFYVMGQIQFKF